jgi:hypothetical protein
MGDSRQKQRRQAVMSLMFEAESGMFSSAQPTRTTLASRHICDLHGLFKTHWLLRFVNSR